MITEDYVSFETAKLLKEKGFNERCLKEYYINGNLSDVAIEARYNTIDNQVSAPTLQMAMKWLKEKYNLYIEVYVVKNYCKKELEYVYTIQDLNFPSSDDGIECVTSYSSSEEASEAAIKYCLENLI